MICVPYRTKRENINEKKYLQTVFKIFFDFRIELPNTIDYKQYYMTPVAYPTIYGFDKYPQ